MEEKRQTEQDIEIDKEARILHLTKSTTKNTDAIPIKSFMTQPSAFT